MQDAKSMSESIPFEITFSIHGRLFVVIQVKIVRYETEIPNLLRKSEFETHVKKTSHDIYKNVLWFNPVLFDTFTA